MCCSCAALQYTMKSLALILGLLLAVQAVPAKGPTPLDVHMPVIEEAPVPILPKVLNGQPATLGQFPYHAAIVIGDAEYCGGSLIARDWILTAAHCAQASSFQVILGRIQWQGDGGVSVVFTERIVHFNWNRETFANDIALLRLPIQLELSKNIELVALTTPADASNTFAGEIAQVSGFGMIGAVSPVLLWGELPIITNTECAQTWGRYIISSTICTSGAGDTGIANSDLGGPLVIYRIGVGFTQIGVASFWSSGNPSAYARVTSFRDWIQKNSGV